MIARVLFGVLMLSLLLPAARGGLESRMSLHMAVELPGLLLLGWQLGGVAPGRWTVPARIDADGLLCATTSFCVLALWMLPAALDIAVLDPGVALIKYVLWIGTGALLRTARSRTSPVIAAFFLVNASWMTATAGLLYLDAEQQLCVNYLIGDQQVAGWALLSWSVAVAAIDWRTLRCLLCPRGDCGPDRDQQAAT